MSTTARMVVAKVAPFAAAWTGGMASMISVRGVASDAHAQCTSGVRGQCRSCDVEIVAQRLGLNMRKRKRRPAKAGDSVRVALAVCQLPGVRRWSNRRLCGLRAYTFAGSRPVNVVTWPTSTG